MSDKIETSSEPFLMNRYIYVRVHQIPTLLLEVNNSLRMGMNIVPVLCWICARKIFSQPVMIYRSHMTLEYYNYLAMTLPSD